MNNEDTLRNERILIVGVDPGIGEKLAIALAEMTVVRESIVIDSMSMLDEIEWPTPCTEDMFLDIPKQRFKPVYNLVPQKVSTLNQNRPMVRSMRSVNRNR